MKKYIRYIFTSVPLNLQSSREQSVTMRYFPFLRDWIADFLDNNKDMTASLIGHNMLIEQVMVRSDQLQ